VTYWYVSLSGDSQTASANPTERNVLKIERIGTALKFVDFVCRET